MSIIKVDKIKIIKDIADELDLPMSEVKRVVSLYYKGVAEAIKSDENPIIEVKHLGKFRPQYAKKKC